MIAILRQYALVLWAIISRPWTLLMLGFGLLYIGPFLTAWMVGRAVPDGVMTAVPVVETSSFFGPEELDKIALAGRLESVTEFQTAPRHSEEQYLVLSDGQIGRLGNGGRVGGWHILDQFPALEKLWMSPPDMLSEEGWRRIGEHAALEVLSLPNVSSPDPQTLRRSPSLARAALERLPRLRQLDLRGTGGSLELLLPPVPNLEVLAVGSGRLEENLRTLADGSPRLRVLAIQSWPDFLFTPAMIESLKRMPNLRRVSVEGATRAEDEPAMKRQVAELERALPGVAVHPGTYRSSRVWAAFWATVLGAYLPFVFWFQSSILLATSLGWMLPRRFAPHLFWAMAVSAVCGGIIVALLLSIGVAWVPALTIALFATTLLAGGAFGDIEGIAGRISSAVLRVELIGSLLVAAVALLTPWFIDRWLSGATPVFAGFLLGTIIATVAWKLARQARLPRAVARLQLAAPPGLVIDGSQGASPMQNAGRFSGWQWKLSEWGVDRQIDRPVPAPYAEMLRRTQWRGQILVTMLVTAVAMVSVMAFIPMIIARVTGQRPPSLSQFLPGVMAACTWQACVMALTQAIVMWGQRRGSLVLDFLRPVSRAGYWQGLQQAIARDLVLPALLGVVCMGTAVGLSKNGDGWAWGVAAALLVGIFVMIHAMTLLLAVTRWPLVVGTLLIVLLVAAGIGVVIALSHVLSVSKPADLRMAVGVAGAVLAVGLSIRAGVLWRLEEREIG